VAVLAGRRRVRVRVEGVVQGVGFRPHVYRLARELGLAGWVRNDERRVVIEVEVEHGPALRRRRRAVRRPEGVGYEGEAAVELAYGQAAIAATWLHAG
jgi:acylphosphatase